MKALAAKSELEIQIPMESQGVLPAPIAKFIVSIGKIKLRLRSNKLKKAGVIYDLSNVS